MGALAGLVDRGLMAPHWAEAMAPVEGRIARMGQFLREELASDGVRLEAALRSEAGSIAPSKTAAQHREAGAARADGRRGVEAHPLARGLAVQVHRQLGVDEVPRRQVELARHAVAAVCHGEHPLQRARVLAGHEGVAQPGPDRGRAGLDEGGTDHRPPLHRRQVAVDPGLAAVQRRRGRRQRRRGGRARGDSGAGLPHGVVHR